MAAWSFSATDLLFPLAVVALWGGIFLLMLFIIRFAAHEHDSEAEAQETAFQEALSHTRAPTMPPLPA